MSFDTEHHPGVLPAPAETRGFAFNHTMLRVRDPKASLAFYSGVLGMRVLRKLDFPEMEFSLYFLAHPDSADPAPDDTGARTAYTFSRRGVLEFTHNWGTEKEADFAYHDGNAEPQGFGHICISVPDLDAAIAWFDSHGVEYVKRPEQGKMKDIAFIKDPDGYWIEIVEAARLTGMGA